MTRFHLGNFIFLFLDQWINQNAITIFISSLFVYKTSSTAEDFHNPVNEEELLDVIVLLDDIHIFLQLGAKHIPSETKRMSWGNSWSSGNSFSNGSGGGWGNSSWGSSSGNKDPEGTHNASCIAGSGGWGNSGLMRSYYDESCSGCRHDRAKSPWGSSHSGGNPALKMAALFGVGVLAKKSLWD